MSSINIQQVLTLRHKDLTEGLTLDLVSARIEIQCLLMEIMQVGRATLLAYPERELTQAQYTRFSELLQRRLSGEPIAYLLGYREFYGLRFSVTPATLIPRPETELLVDITLQHIPQQSDCRVLDLGTGCGAIALSVAHARPHAKVVAVDRSPAALEVAQANLRHMRLANATMRQSDWFEGLSGEQFDMIVSNPPYIADHDPHLNQGDLRHEPSTALVSGSDGLHDIRAIIADAEQYLHNGGWLLLEHGYNQAAEVRALLKRAGFNEVFSATDLAGIERVSGGRCQT